MIGSSENRISYNGNGIATEFAYTFKILEKSDIKVLHVAIDGTEELLTKDYYVDMEKSVVLYPGYAPGAEIPEQNRPPILPVGERLVIYREVPITQESALDKHWPFNVIEAGLDKLTIICQQLFDRLQRSFYVSESTSTNFDTKVPVEAGKTFRVKDDGTGFEVTEDPGKVIDGAKALLKQTTEQAEFANEQADASSQYAVNAQNAANTAEKIATDLGLVDEAVQTAVSSAEQASNSAATANEKADVATAKADIATDKANEASASAATATTKADAASTSATSAAQSYANADAVATQLTEYLATKESLTAPAVDKTLLIDGAAADSKVVGELKSDLDIKESSYFESEPSLRGRLRYSFGIDTTAFIDAQSGNITELQVNSRTIVILPILRATVNPTIFTNVKLGIKEKDSSGTITNRFSVEPNKISMFTLRADTVSLIFHIYFSKAETTIKYQEVFILDYRVSYDNYKISEFVDVDFSKFQRDGTNLFDKDADLLDGVYNNDGSFTPSINWKTTKYGLDFTKYQGKYLYTNVPDEYYRIKIVRPDGSLRSVLSKNTSWENPLLTSENFAILYFSVANSYLDSAMFTTSYDLPSKDCDFDYSGSRLLTSYGEDLQSIVLNTDKLVKENSSAIASNAEKLLYLNDISGILTKKVAISSGEYIAAHEPSMVVDESKGIAYVSYACSKTNYGETWDTIALSVFPLKQPWKAETYTIARHGEHDVWNPISAITHFINGNTVRVTFSIYSEGIFKLMYVDFNTETKNVGTPQDVKFTDGKIVNNVNVLEKLQDLGYGTITPYSSATAQYTIDLINSTCKYVTHNGYVYGAITGEFSEPLIFRSNDNLSTLEVMGVIPALANWECQLAFVGERLYALNRISGQIAPTNFYYSDDFGSTWTYIKSVSMKASKPALLSYNNGLLMVYNGHERDYNPISGQDRYKFIISYYDGENEKIYLNLINPYGLVYPCLYNYKGDVYLLFSDGSLFFDINDEGKDLCYILELGKFNVLN